MNTSIVRSALVLGFCVICTIAAHAQYYRFTTIAGSAGHGYSDGTNSAAQFYLPGAVAVDRAGNIWVADTYNDVIRKITPSGVVTTIAGFPEEVGATDGTGAAARFAGPGGIAVDSAANIYVADTYAHTIRKVTLSGTNAVVTTFAGSPGTQGSADGPSNTARFFSPQGLAVDSADNLYVVDCGNSTIRRITPAGEVSTLAGLPRISGSQDGSGSNARFSFPQAVAVDGEDTVYVADSGNNTIRQMLRQGDTWTVRTIAGAPILFPPSSIDGTNTDARFSSPKGITVDAVRNLYVADTQNNTIRKISPVGADWVTTTLAGLPMASGSADGLNSAALFTQPGSIAAGADAIYVADTWNSTIRKITVSGTNASVSTLAGCAGGSGSADGMGAAARFGYAKGIATDRTGNVYVTDDWNHAIRQLTRSGDSWIVSTIAGLAGVSGGEDGPGTDARFLYPYGVVADSSGKLYVTDASSTIREISRVGGTWQVTTIAGAYRQEGSTDGPGSAARFRGVSGITMDQQGNLYVTEVFNNTVRKLAPTGTNWMVTTLAGSSTSGWGYNVDGVGTDARFSEPEGIVADAAGNLYVSDSLNHTIRKLSQTANGWLTTTISGDPSRTDSMGHVQPGYADGTNTQARFNCPMGIALDSSGNLYVGDSNSHIIRKLSRVGEDWVVSTIGGLAGFEGSEDGTGSEARFGHTAGVALDPAGNIYASDPDNCIIRCGQPTQVPPGPVRITYSASLLMFYCSLSATNSILETSTSLSAGAAWTPLNTGLTRFGNTLILPYDPSVPAAFFRLRSR